jgi:hypothetical protein
MKLKHFIPVLALTLIIWISGRQAVNAGPPSVAANTPTNAATVKGTVKVQGTVPRQAHISMAADPSCAKLNPAGVSAEDIVADSDGELENVIVFVSDGLGDRAFTPPSQPAVMGQKGCMYEPHVVAMQANQALEVVNHDPTTHNIHPMPANNREWNKAEIPGSTMEETFQRAEIAIPVKCNVHPWMRGYVAVFKHPYFVVTGKNGSFDLSNLPPGTYTIEAWHEKLGTAIQQITIGANETKNLNFVFKSKPGV